MDGQNARELVEGCGAVGLSAGGTASRQPWVLHRCCCSPCTAAASPLLPCSDDRSSDQVGGVGGAAAFDVEAAAADVDDADAAGAGAGAAGRSLFLFTGTTGADTILPAGRDRFGMGRDGKRRKRSRKRRLLTTPISPISTMVKLVQTDRIQSALQTLVDARGEQRSRLPLELLTAIQDHLDDEGGTDVEKDAAAQRASWVEHRLLAHISRWNRSTGGELSTSPAVLCGRLHHHHCSCA